MSIEAWAEAARRKQYCQTAEHQRAIDTVQNLLQGKITADTATSTIASLYEPVFKRGFKHSPVATFWDILCSAIRALGGQQELSERLIGLLNAISRLPDVKDEDGNAITPEWKGAGVYWRGLPELTLMFREYAIGQSSINWHGVSVRVLLTGPFYMSRHRARRRDGQCRLGCSSHASAKRYHLWRHVPRSRQAAPWHAL